MNKHYFGQFRGRGQIIRACGEQLVSRETHRPPSNGQNGVPSIDPESIENVIRRIQWALAGKGTHGPGF